MRAEARRLLGGGASGLKLRVRVTPERDLKTINRKETNNGAIFEEQSVVLRMWLFPHQTQGWRDWSCVKTSS